MPDQTWTAQLQAHLELAKQVASRLPANELLVPEELNKVLQLLSETKYVFLFQCELQGFNVIAKD